MIYLIAGGTHTGKTLLAQRLMEKYGWPYLSIDHLKMGLIRSGLCPFRPDSPEAELTDFLWPVVREIVKTCIENRQNLIVEGCYIPFDFAKDFDAGFLREIRYVCLIFSRRYLEARFDTVLEQENAIERRMPPSDCDKESMIAENERNLLECRRRGLKYILTDTEYTVSADAWELNS